MINFEWSADCPCCGSHKTERKDVDVYERSYNTIVIVIHNECRDCKAEFVEKFVTDLMKYDTISDNEVDE